MSKYFKNITFLKSVSLEKSVKLSKLSYSGNFVFRDYLNKNIYVGATLLLDFYVMMLWIPNAESSNYIWCCVTLSSGGENILTGKLKELIFCSLYMIAQGHIYQDNILCNDVLNA